MSGTLFLLPNLLGESSPSAVLPDDVCRLAARLDYFIGENAKSTRAFLKRIDRITPLSRPIQEIMIAELNVSTPTTEWPALLAPILNGSNGALVSEAGCPAVADPGAGLVGLAHAKNVTVKPLVGPSSLLLALMASGLNGQSFVFLGYLPSDPALRVERIREIERHSRQTHQTQIFIETPYRNAAMMQALTETCAPKTLLCVARELTLPGEFVATRPAAQWRQALPDLNKRPTVFLLLAQ